MKVAVIPARGGSKRIPRKNIREFAGKPMIGWSIDCARDTGLFDRILVSTDDEEIAQVARDFGAEAPFVRPAALADDYAGTTEVVAHTVDWLQTEGVILSAVCCIYATAPFMQTDDVRRGLEILETGRWQFVFSATTYPSPIFRSFTRAPEGGVEMVFPQFFASRSQDLPDALHDAAQFYWGRPPAWQGRVQVFGPSSTVVLVPRWRVQDIDTAEDWIRAESMASYFGALDSVAVESGK